MEHLIQTPINLRGNLDPNFTAWIYLHAGPRQSSWPRSVQSLPH